MKETTKRLLDKAARAIQAAERELENQDAEFSVARAYYAMFYVAEALLGEKGLRFKKHGGVHGAFGENFTKTGAMDPKYHRWLLAAFEKRITADYGIEDVIESADAVEGLNKRLWHVWKWYRLCGTDYGNGTDYVHPLTGQVRDFGGGYACRSFEGRRYHQFAGR